MKLQNLFDTGCIGIRDKKEVFLATKISPNGNAIRNELNDKELKELFSFVKKKQMYIKNIRIYYQ